MALLFFPAQTNNPVARPVIEIGPYKLQSRVLLAPMAGISDKPFRRLCRRFGAGLTASEMLSARVQVQDAGKSRNGRNGWDRMVHRDEDEPRAIQIAGADPALMAEAARLNVEHGAQIIDINMGCPVKKILKQASGSALLKDEALVGRILDAVVAAVDVPVTLKIRTGWSPELRNGVTIARIAEQAGIRALAVHGRTRADMFNGDAEYDTIAAIKQAVTIPVIANGDINDPLKARSVMHHTGVDAVMIGRGARGRPWLFREIGHYLETGEQLPTMAREQIHGILSEHVRALHAFYGTVPGLGFARKHTAWYLESLPGARDFRRRFNTVDSLAAQLELIDAFFAADPAEVAAAGECAA